MTLRRLRVGVLFGGRSGEHEVSLQSARAVMAALERAGHDVVPIGITREGRWLVGGDPMRALSSGERTSEQSATMLPEPGRTSLVALSDRADGLERLGQEAPIGSLDVVFPVLHGTFGEDGTVQGLLELAGVAYVGAGVAASALCMDKDIFKKVLRDSGIPVTRHVAVRPGDRVENPFGYPCFVKPARLGSSVGITKVHDESELGPALELAFRHDEKVLIEEFVDGIEVEVGVLGNREPVASLPGQIVPLGHEWYDYSSKYDEGGMDLIIPPELPADVIEQVQRVAVEAFRVTECEGMARADCFVVGGDTVVVNELNTIPGFTATSVYAKLFEASGVPYEELLQRLIGLALERQERRSRLQY